MIILNSMDCETTALLEYEFIKYEKSENTRMEFICSLTNSSYEQIKTWFIQKRAIAALCDDTKRLLEQELINFTEPNETRISYLSELSGVPEEILKASLCASIDRRNLNSATVRFIIQFFFSGW